MISVGSMVQVHPDPPLKKRRRAKKKLGKRRAKDLKEEAKVTEERGRAKGAIAQLGEHLLCKQRVVGSIPSSSTTTRWLE